MEELFRLAQVVLEARNMQNHEQHTVAAAELKEVLLEAKERECATELQAYKYELARAHNDHMMRSSYMHNLDRLLQSRGFKVVRPSRKERLQQVQSMFDWSQET